MYVRGGMVGAHTKKHSKVQEKGVFGNALIALKVFMTIICVIYC